MARRNPIQNAPGRTSYYTNSGTPYSSINQPTDIKNIDGLAQPLDAVFMNKDASGTRSNGDFKGSGVAPVFSVTATYAVGAVVAYNKKTYKCKTAITTPGPWVAANWDVFTGPNILWNNQEGDLPYNGATGQGIGVVKVTALAGTTGPGRYQYGMPETVNDIPFVIYGTTRSVNGRRLNGTAAPNLVQRKLHMRETIVTKAEYELVDPKNPFLVKVKDHKQSITRFPLEIVDAFLVKNVNQKKSQFIPLDRGFAPSAIPMNEDINKLPYQSTVLSNNSPYIRNIQMSSDGLSLTLTPVMQGTGTMSIDWGDTNTDTGLASGTETTHTYAATGVYDVKVTNDGDSNDFYEIGNLFMKDASYVPIDLSFATPTFTANGTNGTKSTVTVNGTPFIKIFVDWGDGGFSKAPYANVPSDMQGYTPVTQTAASTTFDISHNYKAAGSYNVKIYAEHLIDGALAPERKQISTLIPVTVS